MRRVECRAPAARARARRPLEDSLPDGYRGDDDDDRDRDGDDEQNLSDARGRRGYPGKSEKARDYRDEEKN
jgi:hypothetical protein